MNDPVHQTDRELFEAVSSGDVRALAELAGRHARGLYDFALRGTLDEHQAAFVLDNVFRRIADHQTRVPAQIDFRTWLYSLCLVEVLGLSNEPRTARVSTDDARFYQRTTDVSIDMAHWVWQAARGLRTRDYCVLDLTLRRGLTPEEVAEAASLTRSNLYASIGRARGAFEETFAAMLLYEYGREACLELDEMVDEAEGPTLRPALRHQIIDHADDCDACRRTLDSLPPAAGVYISLADIEVPDAVARRILGDASAPLPGEENEPESHSPTLHLTTAAAAALAAGTAALDPDVPPQDATGLWEEQDATAQADPQPASPEPSLPEPPFVAGPVFAGERDDSDIAPQPPTDVGADDDRAVAEDVAPGGAVMPEDEDLASRSAAVPEDEDLAPTGAAVPDDEDLTSADETVPEDEEPALQPLGAAPSLLATRERLARSEIRHEAREQVERPSLGRRVAGLTTGQPMIWTYALLGVAAVIAVYLGIAVADSLQSGGGDSGAVPLDTAPGVSAEREIDCGEAPIEMNAGDSTIISFDENALDGYRIETLSFAPVSDFAEFEDMEATLENPYTIRFEARPQETAEQRTEEFELRIKWQRGEESASSACPLLVNISPQQ